MKASITWPFLLMPPTSVFWPSDVNQAGFCYGWSSPVICVAGVFQADTLQEAASWLSSLKGSRRWEALIKVCGAEPVVLGTCKFTDVSGSGMPSVPSLELCDAVNYNIIFYYRHLQKTLRFYSLDGLQLDVTNRPQILGDTRYIMAARHDFTALRHRPLTKSINEISINQFNSSKALESMVQEIQQWPRKHFLRQTISTTLKRLGCRLLHVLGFLSFYLTTLCNFPILPFNTPPLKDISAIVQQIDVRAEQGIFFASETGTLRRNETVSITVYSARYTNYFNTLWLILNDIIIGFAVSAFLCDNHIVLSRMLNSTVEYVLISWIQWVLRWLDSWPAGLKLNTELSNFYTHTFISLIATWGDLLMEGSQYSSSMIYAVGLISCGGVTLAISVFMDLLAILTFHIYLGYMVSSAVYQRMLQTAGSLWNLFRGKRYNVLRGRTDSWEYDLDQLLFGTILFTLVAFLFPTVLAYYSLFALMRLGILIIQAALDTLLAFMNHFPLFALMLRVKDPWRLPGGIYFDRLDFPQSKYTLLVIKNQPLALSTIFFQYIQLSSRLMSHYNPLRLLGRVLSGRYLAAIPRYSIRYNKIPAEHSGHTPATADSADSQGNSNSKLKAD